MIAVAERSDKVLLSPTASAPELSGLSRSFYRIFPSDFAAAGSDLRRRITAEEVERAVPLVDAAELKAFVLRMAQARGERRGRGDGQPAAAGEKAVTATPGGKPMVLAAAGEDFGSYRTWLEGHGVDTSGIVEIEDEFCASFFCTTDSDQNQIDPRLILYRLHPGLKVSLRRDNKKRVWQKSRVY